MHTYSSHVCAKWKLSYWLLQLFHSPSLLVVEVTVTAQMDWPERFFIYPNLPHRPQLRIAYNVMWQCMWMAFVVISSKYYTKAFREEKSATESLPEHLGIVKHQHIIHTQLYIHVAKAFKEECNRIPLCTSQNSEAQA